MNVKNFKILGQEPAAILGLVQAVLTMLLSFGLFGLTPETNGVILAAVSAGFGLVAAYATRTALYAAVVGFAQAVLVLAVTFGLQLDDIKQGAILATVSVAAGLFLRNTTDSTETKVSSASPGTKKHDLELLALEDAVIRSGPQGPDDDPVPVALARVA